MPQFLQPLPVKAGGNISPSVFVALDGAADFQVRQATANDIDIVGVSGIDTNVAPNLDQALFAQTITPYHAVAGGQVNIYTDGDICLLTIGSGGCTSAQRLMSDSNGAGIIHTTGNWYGARSLQAGVSGDLISVLVENGYR